MKNARNAAHLNSRKTNSMMRLARLGFAAAFFSFAAPPVAVWASHAVEEPGAWDWSSVGPPTGTCGLTAVVVSNTSMWFVLVPPLLCVPAVLFLVRAVLFLFSVPLPSWSLFFFCLFLPHAPWFSRSPTERRRTPHEQTAPLSTLHRHFS
jgi:hypothetical protein